MSGTARMLRTLRRYLDRPQASGYDEVLFRDRILMRCRVLAARLIEGRA